MFLSPLATRRYRGLFSELAALYASRRAFPAPSRDLPATDGIRPTRSAAALDGPLARPDAEVLLAREAGRLVGIAVTLARRPDPADPDPWIGLLMVAGGLRRQGHGRRLAALVEDRFRAAGRTAVRVAVPDDDTESLSFCTALGYTPVDHCRDLGAGRPCTVLRRALDPDRPRTRRRAARVAVLDPQGAVFLLRCDNAEAGVRWAMPGGGIEQGETPRECARRELREETGWTDIEPGPPLCACEHDFTHLGAGPARQFEHMHLARGPRREPTGSRLAASHAADGILAWRWWTPEELAAAPEPLWPPDLAPLLAARAD